MQKKRKIIISIAISLGLALAATQISNNGGLQSSILAPLQSCKTGAITSLERCKTPLTTEKTRIQKEIDVLDKKIVTKKKECTQLSNMANRAKQLKTCRSQLSGLEKEKKTQETAMKAINAALAKLVSELPFQQERTQLQTEIATLTTQIANKTTECATLKNQKKVTEANVCQTQLDTLRKTKITKETALNAATEKLKKIAGAAAITSIPTTPVIPKPTLLQCCADSKAKNFNSTCGIAPNTYSNPGLCVYPTNPGCTDSTALNYDAAHDADDGSCQYGSLLCMDLLALNPMSPLPCTYFQDRPGCTNRQASNYDSNATVDDGSCQVPPLIQGCMNTSAHNFNPSATEGDSSCMTCSDGAQNGDEKGVDCGGEKCEKCPEDNSTTIIDSGSTPQFYCDVPSATNYEQHDQTDIAYQASASACNFCGNETREGVVLADGTTQPETLTGDTGTTVQVAEECEDGKDDKPYDGCYQCRLETCGDELALCRAYKFTGGEGESGLSSKLRSGINNNPASQRPEWNNHHVDVVTTRGRDFATFGATCIRDRDTKIVSYTGYRTVFGLNVDGSVDTQDNGWGSPDYGNLCANCNISNLNLIIGNLGPIYTGPSGSTPTRNKIIRGVAVPREMLTEIFGTNVNYRRVRVDVTGPKGCFRYPVVDEGPHEYTWTRKCSAILDMTYVAAVELGLLDVNSNPQIKWTIRENAGEDFSQRLTSREMESNFTSMTFNNTNGYTYRQYTDIDYPREYFMPTPCN